MLELSAAVIAFDQLFDLSARRNDDVDVFPEREPKILRGAQVKRIDQRNAERVVVRRQREVRDEAAPGPRESAAGFPAESRSGESKRIRCPSVSAIDW